MRAITPEDFRIIISSDSIHSELENIPELFTNFLKSINSKPEDQKRLLNYLKFLTTAFTNPSFKLIATIINESGMTTLHELLKISCSRSLSSIQHHISTGLSSKLIQILSKNDKDYELYLEFWRGHYPNTHGSPIFYVTTETLNKFIEDFPGIFSNIISKKMKEHLQRRKLYTEKFISRRKVKHHEEEKKRIDQLTNALGSCARCNFVIRRDAKEKIDYQFVGEEIHCRRCISEMYQTGEMKDKLKQLQKWKSKSK